MVAVLTAAADYGNIEASASNGKYNVCVVSYTVLYRGVSLIH